MRNVLMLGLPAVVLALIAGCATAPKTQAQREGLVEEAQATVKQMTATDQSLGRFLETSFAYAVFPSVGKGGFIAGGAYGRGVVFRDGEAIGFTDLSQATIGAQIGGQTFKEIVAFEDEAAFNRFKTGKFSLAANASAVALKSGAAASARYTEGVALFVEPVGGLMVEAAIGGQQFTYVPR